MSTDDTTDHVNTLLAKADKAVEGNDLQNASEVLREASQLDSGSAQIKERWSKLQNLEAGGDVVELLRDYLSNQDARAARNALQALKSKQLSNKDAAQATELLLLYERASETSRLLDRDVVVS